MNTPPRAPARRNGHHEHPPADWPPPRPPLERAEPEPRWTDALLFAVCVAVGLTVLGLGAWKAYELVAHAL